MAGVLGSIGNANEPYALLMGIIAILSSVLFFLLKFNIIQINYVISDDFFMWFFAIFAFVSGVIHLFTTIGLIGTGK